MKIQVFWDGTLCLRWVVSDTSKDHSAFKMSTTTHPTIQCHIPENLNLQQHHSTNFKWLRCVSKNPLWIWLDPRQVSVLAQQVSVNRKQNVGTETAVLVENMVEFWKKKTAYISKTTVISCLTSVIHSLKSHILHENTNQEPIAHYFKWKKL